jgi:hypothetical protein
MTGRPPTRREDARRFLIDALRDGPTPSREVRGVGAFALEISGPEGGSITVGEGG